MLYDLFGVTPNKKCMIQKLTHTSGGKRGLPLNVWSSLNITFKINCTITSTPHHRGPSTTKTTINTNIRKDIDRIIARLQNLQEEIIMYPIDTIIYLPCFRQTRLTCQDDPIQRHRFMPTTLTPSSFMLTIVHPHHWRMIHRISSTHQPNIKDN